MTDLDESVLLDDGGDISEGLIDENVLLDEEPKEIKEETDLYDDAIAPSNVSADVGGSLKTSEPTTPVPQPTTTFNTNVGRTNTEGKKYCCYIGNLSWFTTDSDLMKALSTTGIPYAQFADMKFFENRTNGQSKGYALVVFHSEDAVRMLMETLPSKQIHGLHPSVLSYSKMNQAKLEDAQAKTQTRPDVKKKQVEDGCVNMGTIRISGGMLSQGIHNQNRGAPMGRNNPPPLMMPNASNMMRNGPQPLMGSGPPAVQMRLQINGQPVQVQPPLMNTASLMGGMNQQMQHQPMGMGQPRSLMQPMGMQPAMNMGMGGPPPGQPAQFQNRPPQLQGSMGMGGVQPLMNMNTSIRPPNNGMPPVHVNPQMFPGMQGPPLTEAEFEDVMNRNRTVSSSAISRAVADAAVGDLKGSTETILTAIALIKQSRVGHDERCRQLIYTLEDTLKGLESKTFSSRSKSHRDRSRSRERERKRRRRSRTRSRSYSRSPSPRRRRY